MQTTLRIINSIVEGCDSVLPIWSEPPIVTQQFKFCVATFEATLGNEREIKMPNGENVRRFLVQILTALQNIMLQDIEDDTKSLLLLCQVSYTLAYLTLSY